MKKLFTVALLIPALITVSAQEEKAKDKSFKDMDATAFCNYNGFHPESYIKDNNWEILYTLHSPHTLSYLDTLGIEWKESQIQLLRIGGLLEKRGKIWQTHIPIFDNKQTSEIRKESKALASHLIESIEPDCRKFVEELSRKGYGKNAYSLMFSYVLDGKIWQYLYTPEELEQHPTWSGCYWIMYEHRPTGTIGTNSFDMLSTTWSDTQQIRPNSKLLIQLSECIAEGQTQIKDKELAIQLAEYGYTDKEGHILLLTLDEKKDNLLNQYASGIVNTLTYAVKTYSPHFCHTYHLSNEKIAATIFWISPKTRLQSYLLPL